MTPKVGDARVPAAPASGAMHVKSLKLLSFDAVFRQVHDALVARPGGGPLRQAVEPREADWSGWSPFARNGTEPGADSPLPGSVDPLELSLALPVGAIPREPVRASTPTNDAASLASLERVVERLSFGGDRRMGTARLELGGAWTGTVLVVHASGREVRLELSLAAGGDGRALAERLAARLRARGLTTDVSIS